MGDKIKTALVLFIIALIIRLATAQFWQFDGLYGQDAFAYLDQAIAITKNLPQGQPPPADFFWPNGYPLVIAFFSLLFGPTTFAGQIPALLCGALLAPLTYLLCQDLFECNADYHRILSTRMNLEGTAAGLLVAVAGQPILSSIVIMADMPALFWATLAVWLVVRAVRQPQKTGAYLLAAGAALALAVITRWLFLLLAPVLGLYLLFKVYERKLSWWQPWPALISGSMVLAPQLWLNSSKPESLLHSWLLGWNLTNFFRREFENVDGQFYYHLPNAIFYAQPAGHPAYIFPLLGLAGLWGLWRLWQTRQWGPLILLLGWFLSGYLFLAGIPYQNFRFGLTHYLPWVLLTGFGLSDLLSTSITKQRDRGAGGIFSSAPPLPCSSAVFKLVIILSLLAMLAWAYPMLNSFLTSQNQSKVIARQVEQAVPGKATLVTFGLTLTLQHYTHLNTIEIFHQDTDSLQTLSESHQPLYLLLDISNLEAQWQGKTPHINYRWLKKNMILQKMGLFPPYTLFKVSKPE